MAPKFKTWNERLAWILTTRGVRKSELAKACGVSRSSVQEWVDGTTGDLKLDNLFSACDLLKIRPRWLALGQGGVDDNSPSPRLQELIAVLEDVPEERLHLVEEFAAALANAPKGKEPRPRTAASAAR